MKYYSACSSDVEGPRQCHTERSESETEKQKSHINKHIVCGIDSSGTDDKFQGRNRDMHLESKDRDTKVEGMGWDELGDG